MEYDRLDDGVSPPTEDFFLALFCTVTLWDGDTVKLLLTLFTVTKKLQM